jgi:integrase
MIRAGVGHAGDLDDKEAAGSLDSATAERLGKARASEIPMFSGYNRAIQDSRMTFAFFVESKFIPEHVEHKAAAGRTHYQAILKHLLRPETVNEMFNQGDTVKARLKSVPDWPYLDEVQLCEFGSDHVRHIISAAFARQYSAQTVKHIRNVIFAIVSHAQREGCFNGPNPVSQVKLPRAARPVGHNLNLEQTRAILGQMQFPEKEIALITITTGMNILEICNLQWKHVNLTDWARLVEGGLIPPRSIAVRTHWNNVGLGDSKRGRQRNIEIPDLLVSMFENVRDRRANPVPDDFVLVSEDGEPVVPGTIREGRLKPIGRKLGLPWLSWRVLVRAHTALLSEFRAQLNDHMVLPALQKTLAITESEPNCTASVHSINSGTIRRKFQCRSFRVGR